MLKNNYLRIFIDSISIGGRKLIEELEVNLNYGDIKLINAPNGTGKSVLLSILSGWDEEITSIQVKGSFKIGSKIFYLPNDLIKYRKYAKKRISYLSHKLYEESLGITFGEEINFIEKKYNSIPNVIQNSLLYLKAKNNKDSLVEKMAKGHKQLMALIDVFSGFNNNDLILLDEPTSYLSDNNFECFLEQIDFIAHTCNCALLIATNDKRLFSHFNNQVIFEKTKQKYKDIQKLFTKKNPIFNLKHVAIKLKGYPIGHSGKLPIFFNEEIKSNESVILYGPNGSGKSTFLNICAGLMQIKGKLEFYDNQKKIRKRELYPYYLSVLFQEPRNYEFRGTSDEILISQKETEKKYFNEFYNKFLNFYSIPIKQNPKTLSSGQLRMIWIASMLGWAGKWILDEPDSSLDSNSLSLFFFLLDIHLANKGTVIIATHNMKLYEKYNFREIKLK